MQQIKSKPKRNSFLTDQITLDTFS